MPKAAETGGEKRRGSEKRDHSMNKDRARKPRTIQSEEGSNPYPVTIKRMDDPGAMLRFMRPRANHHLSLSRASFAARLTASEYCRYPICNR